MASDKNRAAKGTAKRVLKMLAPHVPKILLSLLLSALTVAATLSLPMLFGDAIDLILPGGRTDTAEIRSRLLRTAVYIFICAAATWLMNRVNTKITLSVAKDVRNSLYDKLNRLPVGYMDSHPTGDTVSRVINDTERLSDGLLLGFTQLFSGVLTIFGTLVLMFRVSVRTGLAVALLTPLSLFAAKFIAGRSHRYFTQRAQALGEETACVNEMISNAKLLRALGAEKDALARFSQRNDRLGDASLKAIFFSSLTNPVTRFVNALVYAAVAFIGAVSVITGGAFTVGTLTCMLSYANQYTKPFNEISGVITELQNSLAAAERILALLDEPEETETGKLDAFTMKGGVELKNVFFGYDKTRPVLKNVSLKAAPGQRVAIVGKTGCGKTTLINLLLRFYDPDSGQILTDGIPTTDVDRRALRKNFGMVLQDTVIMAGTVRENLTLGEDYPDEKIIEAAKSTHAWSFIRRLPDGLDTVLGETGEGLSAGQKQLLCVTRVMLADPAVLLLDEATSSIDTTTEIRVRKAFDRLMQGRTSFIVAHRLSTVANADKIIVMKDGEIAESGTHAELLALGGTYAGMIKTAENGL